MSKEEIPLDVYLFLICEDSEGFAEFRQVFKLGQKLTSAEVATTFDSQDVLLEWDDLTASRAAGGLDMKFQSREDCWVFVQIYPFAKLNELKSKHFALTYFKKEPVSGLRLASIHQAEIVTDCRLYPFGSSYPTLCSFRVNIEKIMDELRSVTKGPLNRFPIVFNFADSDDDVSPVFKDPNHHSGPNHDDEDQVKAAGHGGIHPRGGSSLIIFA